MELLTYMGGDSTTQTTGSGVTNGEVGIIFAQFWIQEMFIFMLME
jgi:hypothetical protein